MELKKSPKADLTKTVTLFREVGIVVTLAVVLVAFEWKTKEIKRTDLTEQEVIAAEEEIVPITEEENVIKPKMPTMHILSDGR